mmetsp:Transcript_7161/g.10008  ORF Transcript_7161/g.10008 Transcript_7161/m.10008 type:complete len:207 (-) Transcript_7161:205-825(-)
MIVRMKRDFKKQRMQYYYEAEDSGRDQLLREKKLLVWVGLFSVLQKFDDHLQKPNAMSMLNAKVLKGLPLCLILLLTYLTLELILALLPLLLEGRLTSTLHTFTGGTPGAGVAILIVLIIIIILFLFLLKQCALVSFRAPQDCLLVGLQHFLRVSPLHRSRGCCRFYIVESMCTLAIKHIKVLPSRLRRPSYIFDQGILVPLIFQI